jgi:hypothetical protein
MRLAAGGKIHRTERPVDCETKRRHENVREVNIHLLGPMSAS